MTEINKITNYANATSAGRNLPIEAKVFTLTKEPKIQVITNKKNQLITFDLSFKIPLNMNALDSYTIRDPLIKGLQYCPCASYVTETITGITTMLPIPFKIINNTVVLDIYPQTVIPGGTINIHLACKIIDPSVIPDTFTNIVNATIITYTGNKKTSISNAATVITNNIKITKTCSSKIILGKKDTLVKFNILIENLHTLLKETLTIKDKLDNMLSLSLNASKVYVEINKVKTYIPASISVDANNLVTIIINQNSISQDIDSVYSLGVDLITVVNKDLDCCKSLSNTATLSISPYIPEYKSNSASLKVVCLKNKAIVDIITSINSENKSIDNIENMELSKIKNFLGKVKTQNRTIAIPEINESIKDMLKDINLLEDTLKKKLITADDLIDCLCKNNLCKDTEKASK